MFTNKSDLDQQAIQSVSFALDLLEAIQSINDSHNTNLGLAIGLNMGGPLCGNVLDIKVPSFDILGYPIGNAMKLVNEGQQNVVQVTKQITEYLPQDKFEVTDGAVLVAWFSKKKTQCYNVKLRQ